MPDFDTNPAYAFWCAALAGKKPSYTEAKPECGFYAPILAGERVPLAIFEGDAGLLATLGWDGEMVPAQVHWLKAATKPISDTLYWQARDMGRWPDIDKVVPLRRMTATAENLNSDAPNVEAPTSNRPPEEDKGADLLEQIQNALVQLDELLKDGVKDELAADKAANSKDRLAQLSKEAEAARKAEKKPFDDGAKAVQVKWLPIIAIADKGYDRAVAAISAFQKAERARREAAAAKAAKEAEEARLKAEEERRAAEESGEPVPEHPVEPEPPPAPVPVRSGGALSGRATTLRTTRTYAVVEDWRALMDALFESAEMRELAQAVADRAARGGNPLPGTRVEKEEKAV